VYHRQRATNAAYYAAFVACFYGAILAHLASMRGQSPNGIQEVVGSTPIGSTKLHNVKNSPPGDDLLSEGGVLDANGSLQVI